jgi:hypothetical protein
MEAQCRVVEAHFEPLRLTADLWRLILHEATETHSGEIEVSIMEP